MQVKLEIQRFGIGVSYYSKIWRGGGGIFHLYSEVRAWSGTLGNNSKVGALYMQQVVLCGGKWAKVEIWKENWCGDTPLSHSFSSLFVIYFFKEAWV